MDFFPQILTQYIEQHSSKEDNVLAELRRETYLKCQLPQMVSGHQQGLLLTLLCKILQPQKVLEIGTFTGYSAIAMGYGMPENAKLTTIDINDELADMVAKYIELAGLSNKISHLVGNALEVIPLLDETYDLVFIDADKVNYNKYYNMVFNKVRKGGVILVDNVLWSGKVTDNSIMDKDTLALRKFNEMIKADDRIIHLLLSVRDGLMLIIKK